MLIFKWLLGSVMDYEFTKKKVLIAIAVLLVSGFALGAWWVKPQPVNYDEIGEAAIKRAVEERRFVKAEDVKLDLNKKDAEILQLTEGSKVSIEKVTAEYDYKVATLVRSKRKLLKRVDELENIPLPDPVYIEFETIPNEGDKCPIIVAYDPRARIDDRDPDRVVVSCPGCEECEDCVDEEIEIKMASIGTRVEGADATVVAVDGFCSARNEVGEWRRPKQTSTQAECEAGSDGGTLHVWDDEFGCMERSSFTVLSRDAPDTKTLMPKNQLSANYYGDTGWDAGFSRYLTKKVGLGVTYGTFNKDYIAGQFSPEPFSVDEKRIGGGLRIRF